MKVFTKILTLLLFLSFADPLLAKEKNKKRDWIDKYKSYVSKYWKHKEYFRASIDISWTVIDSSTDEISESGIVNTRNGKIMEYFGGGFYLDESVADPDSCFAGFVYAADLATLSHPDGDLVVEFKKGEGCLITYPIFAFDYESSWKVRGDLSTGIYEKARGSGSFTSTQKFNGKSVASMVGIIRLKHKK